MKIKLLLLLCFILSLTGLSAQSGTIGNAELIDMSEDESILTFSVEGISPRKNDVMTTAKESLFKRLLYDGIESVNDGDRLIQHEKKHWLEEFFKGKSNAPYNRFVKAIEQEGSITKADDEYHGTFNIVVKMKAFLKELELQGIRDGGPVRSKKPQKAVGLAAKKEAERLKAEAEQARKEQAQRELQQQQQRQRQQAQESERTSPAIILITKDGVGPVKIGGNYTIPDVLNRCTLPEAYTQLYDKLYCDRNQFSGDFEIVGELNGTPSLYVFSDEKDKVTEFTVTTPNVTTSEGLSVNSTAKEIQALGGKVKRSAIKDRNTTIAYHYSIELNGLHFFFHESGLSVNGIQENARAIAISNNTYSKISDYYPIDYYLNR